MKKTQSVEWDSLSYKLDPWIREALVSMGFTSMTPVQASTIPLLCQHKDVVVEAATGSGKTLAFLIPVLEKTLNFLKQDNLSKGHYTAVVVSPTRELASQINEVLQNLLNFQREYNDSKDNEQENNYVPQIKSQLLVGSIGSVREDLYEFLENKPHILIGTPGRMLDFLSNNAVKSNSCEIIILDEADKLLDISFLNTTQSIIRQLPRQRRTGLFSATLSSAGSDIFKAGLSNPVKISVQSSLNNLAVPKSLGLFYMPVETELKLQVLMKLISDYKFKKLIVYLPTCIGVTHFYSLITNIIIKKNAGLTREEINADLKMFSLHGKLTTKPRLKALSSFANSNANKSVLLTTDVAARGLDIPDVDLVVQLDPPTDPDVFLHRCGRTGRANKVGRAITFLSKGREEDYIDFMEVKGVEIKLMEPIVIEENDKIWFDSTVKEWILQDRGRHDLAIRSYVGFLRYYTNHSAGSIFRLSSLDYIGLAKMYGLLRLPKMPESKYIEEDKMPEDGFLDRTVNFDTYTYKDQQKEELRLKELKLGEAKKHRKEKSEHRKELKKKNSSWSEKLDNKETKQERREKAKLRRDAVEKAIRENALSDSEPEDETDWKDLVLANKRRKKNKNSEVQGSFDDL
ncbi:hypothetical protein B5S29_g149 [[Candida] boidinii]|uniref:Unnamed protein product n=1 Tax=Candida boidinii TaxID=5477 RepID=A0ACB5TJR1_CANBO|nr:hypothetical protein B5S29_g149 [[Candida] boidinii]GME90130.1 unnamed protein product [[Candida] boidinii]